MGLSSSKGVSRKLSDSTDFNSACDSVYEECLQLSQHAFPGVRPYQLTSASDRLHRTLSDHQPPLPLIQKWVRSPPSRSQVDKALQAVARRRPTIQDDVETLGPADFRAFAVQLYTDAVVSSAGKAVLQRVPIGVAGITGIGVATRTGKELVGTAIGVYALSIAASVYFSLAS